MRSYPYMVTMDEKYVDEVSESHLMSKYFQMYTLASLLLGTISP